MKERIVQRPVVLPWLALLLALTLLLARGTLPASGDDEAARDKQLGPLSPAAERVLALAESKDTSELTALIDDPQRMTGDTDPWFLVHELLVHDRYRAATRFADAGTRVEVKHLKAYAQRIGRRPGHLRHWTILQQVRAHQRRGEWSDIADVVEALALDDEGHEQATVATVRLRELQARAYAQLEETDRILGAASRAARRAAEMGWWIAARTNHELWLQAAWDCGALEEGLAASAGLEDVFEALGDRRRLAEAICNGASLRSKLCRFDPAVKALQDVLDKYRGDIDDHAEGHVLNSIALGHKVLGRYALAQREAGRARAKTERALAAAMQAFREPGPEREKIKIAHRTRRLQVLLPWTLQTQGLVALEIGDPDEAARLFNQAVQMLELLKGDAYDALGVAEHLEEARANLSMLEMWRVRDGRGDLVSVKADLQERLAFYTKEKISRYIQVARCHLAEILRREAQALPAGPQRDKMLRDVLGRLQAVREDQRASSDRYALCITLQELAAAYRAQAETQAQGPQRRQALERARRRQKLALQTAEAIGALDEMTRCYSGLAQIELMRGRPAAALQASHAAVRGISSHFDSLPPGQAALARGKTAAVYTAGLKAALALDDAENAFFFLDGARAGALLTGIERAKEVRGAGVDDGLRMAEAAAREAEATAYEHWMRAEDGTHLPARREAYSAFEAARLRRRYLIQRIQLEARIQADLKYALPAEAKEVCAVLALDEAMVIIGAAGDQAVAVLLRRDGLRLVKLGSAAAIAAACEALSTDEDAGPRLQEIADLRDLLIMPLGLGGDVRRVLISLDGCLAYQPPALLFPRRDVVCIPSGTAYLRALRQRPPVSEGRVIAVGHPDYGRPPAEWGPKYGSAKRGGRFQALPGTEEEVLAVGDLVLVQRQATETRVREVLAAKERLRALHFACHGRVDEDSTDYSALALTPSLEDDGLLTALEIYQLEIDADLVVLSACESGRGRRSKAEGIVGLTNAFLFAGARRVLVSLWSVDDAASRTLMIEFHRRWNHKDPAKRLGAAAALRAAQRYVQTYAEDHKDPITGKPAHPEWKDPHYWAAWQIWGSPD